MQYEIHLENKPVIEMQNALKELYMALGNMTLTDIAEIKKIDIIIE